MANSAVKTPINYDYGDDFNYTRWTENTVLTLLNVNWNSDYRDVWRASSKDALDDWIDAQPGRLVLNNVSLAKFNRNVRINTPINTAMTHNYLRAVNGTNPVGDSSRNYYYFIVDYVYVNPNTTELVLQLDVWQTFGYDVSFGNCFVERGHIGIANDNAFDNYGRDYLNIPEGLDTGGEYRIVKTARETIMDISGDSQYSVLVCSTVDMTKNPGIPTQPKLYSANGSVVDGIASGASFYIFPTPADFTKFMKAYQTVPWVTQGIISVTIIPNLTRYFPSATWHDVAPDVYIAVKYGGEDVTIDPTIDLPYGQTTDVPINVTVPGGTVEIATPPNFTMYSYPTGRSGKVSTALAPNWRDSLLDLIPAQYRTLKKLLTYPYCVIELTTWTGSPLAIRPEAWADGDATIKEQAVMLPPGQRIAFMPYRYNGDSNTSATTDDDNAEHLDFATTLTGFPAVPVVNNMAISWLASNKNGLAFQFSQADWSQQKALRGAQATSDIAGAEIANTGRQTGIANTANMNAANLSADTQMNNMLLGTAGGAIGMIGAVGVGAGVYGAAEGGSLLAGEVQGMNNAILTQNLAVNQNSARSQSAVSSIQTSGQIRDTNVSLARFAARGDYHNAVAGINAKIQDSKMLQPSTAGQFGGDAMNLAHSNVEVSARWKIIDNSTLKRIGNYWLRYGYAVEQFVQFSTLPSDLQCMSKFTYWKLSETYITSGKIPEQFKQTIRGIFEKGVTVWADPGYIGTTVLSDNTPKDGISY